MRKLATAAIGVTALASAFGIMQAQAQTAGNGVCNFERISLNELVVTGCDGMIPVPTPRPDPMTTATVSKPKLDRADLTFIDVPVRGGGEKHVRLIGPRYLPDRAEAIDFRKIAWKNTSTINAAFSETVAFLGIPGLFGAEDVNVADADTNRNDKTRAADAMTVSSVSNDRQADKFVVMAMR